MRVRTLLASLSASALLVAACGDDGEGGKDTAADTTADTSTDATASETTASETTTTETSDDGADGEVVEPPAHAFDFGLEAGQSIGVAPFPNDILLGDDGLVDLAPIGNDSRWGTLANSAILARTDAQIARRKGFGFASSIYFPMNVEPDLATFESKVHFIALDGPENGAVLPAEVFVPAQGGMIGAFPTWGHYLVPGSKYAVIIDVGVEDKDGNAIAVHPDFAALMAAEAPSGASAALLRARGKFAKLRDYMAVRDTAAVIGTVFTTEDSWEYLNALMTAARDFPLQTPTRRVRTTSTSTLTWEEAVDVYGATDLQDYFGVASDVFTHTPGGWEAGNRDDAKAFTTDGEPYKGGTFFGRVGGVINGSIAVPSFNLRPNEATGAVDSGPIAFQNGRPVPTATALVPFSLFLCDSHVDGAGPVDTAIPIAVFTHGGTALRSDALAFANVNCLVDRATITLDLPFHGGRQTVRWFADAQAVVPAHPDIESTYKDPSAGGRTNDYIGDNGGSTTTVGGLFALGYNLDPEIIEANHLAVAVEIETLVRYLKDTSDKGLGAALGITFDTSGLIHESLSFGTSFGSAFLAQTTDIVAAVVSVGSGQMISVNLPMAPNNANLASNLFVSVLGLKTDVGAMTEGAYRDPIVSLFQWLGQLGDPIAYAPLVLRHRHNAKPFHVLGFGDSWDETLFTPAQITFANAWGLPVYATAGFELAEGTPGSDTAEPLAYPGDGAPKANVTAGASTVSAGYFYFSQACHAAVVTPICESGFEPPYPPITARVEPLVFASPICALQGAMRIFMADLADGGDVGIPAPAEPSASDCDDLYVK